MSDDALVRQAQRLLARIPGAREEALAVLNGAVGDHLANAGSSLALPMGLFARDAAGADDLTPLDAHSLPSAFARPRAVLMVHGLMGSQLAWTLGTGDGPGPAHREGEPVEFGAAIAQELGHTALYLRYNSGLHISDNGRALAERLESLVNAWPGGLVGLDVVAHSMGGLVTRSAMHYGLEAGHRWPARVERVCMLGTPSHGAPLEQVAHVTAFTLETIWNPWTKLIGKAINLRSAGIKDLRHGFCLEADWRHKDQDELRLAKPRPTRSPPQVRWFVAAGTQGRPDHWLSKLIGDGLVRPTSARGEGWGTPEPGLLPDAEVRLFDETHHMALMNDPLVLGQVVQWLSS